MPKQGRHPHLNRGGIRSRLAVWVIAVNCLTLAACGGSDLDSLEADTFFEQALPTWIVPDLRDDYMAKRWIQPHNTARAVERDEYGEPVLEISFWT